jgi:CubicO group peptidase (beta-lactamase class C family)
MATLRETLQKHVDDGALPGAVALVARGAAVEVAAVGTTAVDGATPMARDSVFRVTSVTKPIAAAAAMVLVDDGRVALDDPAARWLPELAEPRVVADPAGPVDDTVPAVRPITVADLLDFRAGYGFPDDFSLPAVQLIFGLQNPLAPQEVPPPNRWMAELARIPLLHQPGDVWLYNTCSDILGVLIARASGRSLPDFLGERLFEPLGMADTGFHVPAAKLPRMTTAYTPTPDGLQVADLPDGHWASPPAFPSGAGGLVSTVDDWCAFGRMLLAGGEGPDGKRILEPGSVRLMMTDHITAAQRAASTLFLEGQGWGFGGSVDVAGIDPWNVEGRYGWVGGSGTAAHVVPSTGQISVLMTQVAMTGPTPPEVMRDFWRYAAGV